MSLIFKLPDSYRFTERDEKTGWDIFGRIYRFGSKDDVSPDEIELMDLCIKAGEIHERTNSWPTLAEVLEEQQREHEEWLKRHPGYGE